MICMKGSYQLDTQNGPGSKLMEDYIDKKQNGLSRIQNIVKLQKPESE